MKSTLQEKLALDPEAEITEVILLLFFIILGSYMYVGAGEFSVVSRLFPRFSSAMVVFLSLIMLFNMTIFKNKFGPSVDKKDGTLTDRLNIEETERLDQKEPEDRSIAGEQHTKEPRDMILFLTLVFSFVVLSYLVGLFWGAVIFSFVYGVWNLDRWYKTLLLVTVVFAIGYFFIAVLEINLHTGIYEWVTIGT